MLLASMAPSAAPAPTTVCSSSMNRMISPLGLPYLVQHPLQTLLELAAKLAARHHGAYVQRENPPAAELLRNVPGDYALRQSLGDRRLAHAGAADEHRVVLGPADQRLHRPRYLSVAADHRVELPLPGQLGQVDAEPLERAVAALRAFVGHAMVPADGLQRLVDLLEIDAELGQHRGGVAVVSLDDRHQQMLRADEVVAEPLRLLVRPLQRLRRPRRHEYLRGLVGYLGGGFEQLVQPRPHVGNGHADLLQHVGRDPVVPLQQRHQHVLDVPLAVAVPADDLLGPAQHLPGLLGKLVGSQHHCLHLCAEGIGGRGPGSAKPRMKTIQT